MTTQTSKTFFDTFDFTRASSATYVGTDNRIHTMDAGLPRYELLEDGGRSGIVLERSSTNLIKNNSDLTAWVMNDYVDVTPVYNPEPFKIANPRSYRLTRNSDTDYAGGYIAGCNVEAGKTYCFSVYINRDESTATEIQMTYRWFNQNGWQNGAAKLSDGTQRGGSGTHWKEGGIQDVGFGWVRLWTYCEADKDQPNASVEIRIAGPDYTGSTLEVAYPQLEEVDSTESKPSSMIPTSGTVVTREQDTIKYLLNDPSIKMESGTWLFTGDMTNANLSQGIGVDDARFTGSGTIAYVFDSEGGEVFINGQSAQVTPPVVGTNIGSVIFGGGDKLILSTITYIDGVKDIEGASENATGNFQFSTTFVNGNSLVMDIENERFGKRSLLDANVFNDGSIHDVIEVNRASYGGSYDENGQYVIVGENEPRYGLNPDGSRYLLIEPERTNLAKHSTRIEPSYRQEDPIIEFDAVMSPAGTMSGTRVTGGKVFNFVNRPIGAEQNIGQVYLGSLYVKVESMSADQFSFLLGSSNSREGTSTTITYDSETGELADPQGLYHVDPAGDGWYRIWRHHSQTESTNNIDMVISAPSDAVFHFWGMQYEIGDKPTSLIPVELTPITRLADEVSTTLGVEFKETQGTWIFRGKVEDGVLARNLGHAGLRLTGEGTVVFTFNDEGGSVFFNGGKIFDIAPYTVSPSVVNFGMDDVSVQGLELVTYRSAVISHDAAVELTKVGEFEYDYLFADNVTMIVDPQNGAYGVLDKVDPLSTVEGEELKTVIDFTRATSAVDGNGNVVGINEPRFTSNGWFTVERTATNEYPYSDGTGSSASVAGWKGNATRTQDTLLGEPATKVVLDSGTNYVYGAQNHMTALYTDYVGRSTRSVRVKIEEDGYYFGIRVAGMTGTSYFPSDGRYHAFFDLDAGTLVHAGSLIDDNEFSITEVDDGVFDVVFTTPYFGDNPHYHGIALGVAPKDAGINEWEHTLTSDVTMYITRTQVEASDKVSSYIPTSGTAVTRVADVASKLIDDFPYNPDAGTWVFTADFIDSHGCNFSGIGIDVVRFSGTGTVVVSYDSEGVRVFVDETKVITLPPITTPDTLKIVGSVNVANIQYRDEALSDEDAAALAVGAVAFDCPASDDIVVDYNFLDGDFFAKSDVDSLDSYRTEEALYIDTSRTVNGVSLIVGVDGYMRGEIAHPNNPTSLFGRLLISDANENLVDSDFSNWSHTSDAFTESTIGPLYTGGPDGVWITNADDSGYASYTFPIDDFDHDYINMAMIVTKGSADTFRFGLRDDTFSTWVYAVDFSWLDNKVRPYISNTGYNVSYGVRRLPSHPAVRDSETFFVWITGKPKYRNHEGRFYFYPNGAGQSMEGKKTLVHHAQMNYSRYPRMISPSTVGTGMEGNTSLNLPDGILVRDFGTIAIEGYGEASRFVKNLGFDGVKLTGEGTFAYRWNTSGGEFFANGAKLFDTAPPSSFNSTVEFAVGEIGRVRIFDKYLSSAETKALTDGTFDVDYLFMGGEVFVADFSNEEYGLRDTVDGANSRSTESIGEFFSVARATGGLSNSSSDVMEYTGQGEFRYGYGDTRGILVERGSTNLVVGTNTTPSSTSGVTVTEEGTGPYSDAKAFRLTLTSSGANENGYWTIPNDLTDDDHTVSMWVKFDTATSINLRLWRGPHVVCDEVFTGNKGEWKLCKVTSDNNQAGGAVFLRAYPDPRISQTSGNSLLVSMPQLEVGKNATSFIPTADTVASRARDVVTMDGSFVGEEGTFVVEFSGMEWQNTMSYLFDISPSGDGGLGVRLDDNIWAFFVYDKDTRSADIMTEPFTGGERKIAVSYRAGKAILAIDGSVAATTTDLSGGMLIPTNPTLNIGSRVEGDMMADTVISKFKYYDTFHDVDTIINL